MQKNRNATDRRLSDRSTESWQDSSVRWLMENYDIWSATPARASDQPARPLPFK